MTILKYYGIIYPEVRGKEVKKMKKYYVVLSLKEEFEVEAESLSSAYAEANKLFSECEPDIIEWGVVPEKWQKNLLKKVKKTTWQTFQSMVY